jgi:hypothetical protein
MRTETEDVAHSKFIWNVFVYVRNGPIIRPLRTDVKEARSPCDRRFFTDIFSHLLVGIESYTVSHSSVVVCRHVNQRKQWRGVATRYEKRAVNYRAIVVIASIVIRLHCHPAPFLIRQTTLVS